MPEVAGIQRNVLLGPFTSIKVGGPGDAVATCTSFAAVTRALAWARDHEAPVAVVGKGSNLIVDDAGFRGLVVRNRADAITVGVFHGTLLRGSKLRVCVWYAATEDS